MDGVSAVQLSRKSKAGTPGTPHAFYSAASIRLLFVSPSEEERSEFRRLLSGYPFLDLRSTDKVGSATPSGAMPDVVIIQVQASGLHEPLLKSVERSGTLYPRAAILVLNGEHDSRTPEVEQLSGVAGILSRNAAPDSIAAAVLLATRGFSVLPRPALERLRQAARRGSHGTPGMRRRQADANDAVPLTGRQQQVVHLLLEGLSNRDIAQRLGIAESTVKVHVRSIMNRAGVMSRTQLVLSVLNRAG